MEHAGIYVILASAILLFVVVLNLVRLRRLREEYSWLWLACASFYLVIALIPEVAQQFASFLGITSPINALLFFGIFFIVLILIHYSVVLSKLSTQMKNVSQLIALLDGEQYKINGLFTDEEGEALEIRETPTGDMEDEPGRKPATPERQPR